MISLIEAKVNVLNVLNYTHRHVLSALSNSVELIDGFVKFVLLLLPQCF